MRLFLAAIAEIAGLALVGYAAFSFEPLLGFALAGALLAWFGTELAARSGSAE